MNEERDSSLSLSLSLYALLGTACWLLVILPVGCRSDVGPQRVVFTDITDRAGLAFVHNNGSCEKNHAHPPLKWTPETMGSGCAFFDYDNDGLIDIFLVNSMDWSGHDRGLTPCGLYRNNGDGTFADRTAASGLGGEVYGMGCCVGDFNNDGWDDLFVTALGSNRLFRNEHGRFRDVTAQACVAGVPDPDNGLRWKWSTGCAWFDYNNDGWIDLFVCNYVRWKPERNLWCGYPGGPKIYCTPELYDKVPCTLYRNQGNGRFIEVSAATGVSKHSGKALGVVPCDYNQDGWTDVFVACDTEANLLFRNVGGERFDETALRAGVALTLDGKAKAGMGIDAAVIANDGRMSFVIGNFTREGISLFMPIETEEFIDIAMEAGLGGPSMPFLTFGVMFLDCDLDGLQDVLAVNGHTDDFVSRKDSTTAYAQRPLLFHNVGGMQFQEVGTQCGVTLKQEIVARGCAHGDIDNDGDLDVLITTNNGRPRLLRNDGGNRNHWISIRLAGSKTNRNGFGASITLRAIIKGREVTQTRLVKSGGSYLSQSDSRALFGLADARRADEIVVRWPGGEEERAVDVPSNREYLLVEGKGMKTARASMKKVTAPS